VKSGKIPENSCVVCTLTGHGLKDPDTAIKQSTAPVIKVEASLDQVKSAILDNL
jgi:threonine synthase